MIVLALLVCVVFGFVVGNVMACDMKSCVFHWHERNYTRRGKEKAE